jgi:hypothetical protein
MKETVYAKLNSYAMERTIMEPDSECLTWVGVMSNKNAPVMKTAQTKRRWVAVCRYTWVMFRSELTKYDKLRNVCGNRACINPYHYENISEVCPNGHKRTPETFFLKGKLRLDSTGELVISVLQNCRLCSRMDSQNRYYAKKNKK